MRFKYYLRGIGMGILVATLILMISIQAKGGLMTDQKAIARAKELGYTLAESGDAEQLTIAEKYKSSQDSESADSLTYADSFLSASGDSSSNVSTSEESDDSSEANSDTKNEDDDSETTQVTKLTTVTFQVNDSDSSETVSKHLEEAGLIDDWSDFNDYLIDNGYSKRIRTGSFILDSDMDYQDIVDQLIP